MYFLPLNLKKFDVIKPDWVRPTDVVKLRSSEYASEIFTTSFLEKLSTISKISGVMIFNKINHPSPTVAHADIALINNQPIYINYGLNIVFDDSTDFPSTMRWYSRRFPKLEKKILISAGNTPYMNFTMGELSLEAEHCIDEFVTLVRTDVPHAISSGNGLRTCISIRFHNNHDWDVAVDLFNKTFNQ
jgi:hypothetical protein